MSLGVSGFMASISVFLLVYLPYDQTSEQQVIQHYIYKLYQDFKFLHGLIKYYVIFKKTVINRFLQIAVPMDKFWKYIVNEQYWIGKEVKLWGWKVKKPIFPHMLKPQQWLRVSVVMSFINLVHIPFSLLYLCTWFGC